MVAARYTEVELQLALLDNDLRWLEHLTPRQAESVLGRWEVDVLGSARRHPRPGERDAVVDAQRRSACSATDARTR